MVRISFSNEIVNRLNNELKPAMSSEGSMSTGSLHIHQIIAPSKNFGGKQKGMQPTASTFQHLTISENLSSRHLKVHV